MRQEGWRKVLRLIEVDIGGDAVSIIDIDARRRWHDRSASGDSGPVHQAANDDSGEAGEDVAQDGGHGGDGRGCCGGCTGGDGRRSSDGARACHDRGAASADVSIGEWGAGVVAGVVEVNGGATSRPSGLRGGVIRTDAFQLKGR